MIIDWHNHLYGGAGAVGIGKQGADEFVRSYLQVMDRVGIDKAVFYPWWIRGNDNLDVLVKVNKEYGDRLMAFYAPPIGATAKQMVQDLEKYVNLGFKGLKLVPPISQVYPNDPELYPIYEKALELDIPVNIHCGTVYNNPEKPNECRIKFGMPILLDDVARDFPKLKVGVAHAGRPFIEETLALAVNPNVYIDMTWSQLALGLYPDTMKRVLMAFGPDRIVYGSDTGTREVLARPEDFSSVSTARCETMFRETMQILRELGVDQASVRKIMGENATKLLKL